MRGLKLIAVLLFIAGVAVMVYQRTQRASAEKAETPHGWPEYSTSAQDHWPTTTATAAERFSAAERDEITRTLRAIASNGPFPYKRDGIVFQNREGLLPGKPTGYYREYTVRTAGSRDRGARRIVTGREGETYYTRDHYRSFVPIAREEFR